MQQTATRKQSVPSFCYRDENYSLEVFRTREAAEKAFWEWLKEVVSSDSRRLLLIQGPPGSGKSWLSAYLADQVTRQARERVPFPLKGVYLPWPLEEEADMVTFFQERLAIPPKPKDVSPEAWLRTALAQHWQTSGWGLVLFVDNLDRLPLQRVKTIEREWLRNLAPMDLPIWLVLVRFGPLHDPELRLRGADTISLGAFAESETDLQFLYQRQWKAPSSPVYDFRYPLLNAWLRHEIGAQREDGNGAPASFWRRGLACLLYRRPATQRWAQDLLSTKPLASATSFPLHTFLQIFVHSHAHTWEIVEAPETPEVYRLPYRQIQNDWWPVIEELHETDFLDEKDLAYIMDASLWRFWHDALRQLTPGEFREVVQQ